MKTLIKLSLMALLAILFFNGCRKDTASKTTNQLPVKTIATSGTIPGDMVMTPRGLMPKAQVHLIETGYHLELRDDHVMKIKDGTGELKEDFGLIINTSAVQPAAKSNLSNNVSSSGIQKNLSIIQPNGETNGGASGGWKTYSEWNAGTNVPIGSLSSTWAVPTVPSVTGALIYISDGVESGQYSASTPNLSIEAVMQFGNNGAFGSTASWVIANWCSWNGGAAYSTAVSVSTGTVTGNIVLTNLNVSTYNYTCSFANQSNSLNVTQGNTSNVTRTPIPQITIQSWAFESLESYGFTANTNYPTPAASVNMTAVAIQTGLPGNQTYPTLSWTPVTAAAATNGEHTANINNTNTSSSHGTVDLYYRYCAPSITYPASSYSLSTCGAITPITPTNSGCGGVTYTVSPALPAGLSINSTTGVISGTPTATSAATNYTVTATNTGGTSSKTLTITITGPGSFTYPNIEFHAGAVVTPVSPTVSGTAPTHYTISPALPSNLSINPNTGVISGTAPSQAAAAVNYTVTGTAGTCSSTATASIAIDFQFTFTNNISNPNSGTNPDYGDISITFKNIPSGIEYGDGVFLAGGGKDVFWCPPGNYYVVINPGSSQFPNSTFISFGPSGPSNGGNPGHTFTSVPLSQGNTYLLNIQ